MEPDTVGGGEEPSPHAHIGDAPTFVVEPLDGITNFSHGWELLFAPRDDAAGSLLIREAGGSIAGLDRRAPHSFSQIGGPPIPCP